MEAGVGGYFIHKAQIEFQAAFTVCTPFPFAPHAGAGHFLSLLRQRKKAKKGDCGHRFGFAKLPSLRTVFRAQREIGLAATCGCAASGMQALIPRKTALRSAVPAGGAALYVCGEFSVLKFAH